MVAVAPLIEPVTPRAEPAAAIRDLVVVAAKPELAAL